MYRKTKFKIFKKSEDMRRAFGFTQSFESQGGCIQSIDFKKDCVRLIYFSMYRRGRQMYVSRAHKMFVYRVQMFTMGRH